MYLKIQKYTLTTTMPVQDRTLKGRTRTGRMWVYTNKNGCVYEYTTSRSREGPSNFLRGYSGIIQADGYAGYNESCEENDIQRAACWAHVRRKFFDAAELLPKSILIKAINYALKFWDELEIYCEHGYVDIDNNAAERAMRPVALGRKNWLFAGSNGGGKTAATMLSLIETAKQRSLNPVSYIQKMLEHPEDISSKLI